jgi:hypothetical protein
VNICHKKITSIVVPWRLSSSYLGVKRHYAIAVEEAETTTTNPFTGVVDVFAEEENSKINPEGIDAVGITNVFDGAI